MVNCEYSFILIIIYNLRVNLKKVESNIENKNVQIHMIGINFLFLLLISSIALRALLQTVPSKNSFIALNI